MLTPFQTVGPYLSIGLRAGLDGAPPAVAGRISIVGRLIDGAGEGIPDGILEFWHPGLTECHRAETGAGGRFEVTTIPPAARAGDDGVLHAPHFAVRVLARGILTQYVTRMYLSDPTADLQDPVLARVPAHRRHTLAARPVGESVYHFDVTVQGDHETVFFDV